METCPYFSLQFRSVCPFCDPVSSSRLINGGQTVRLPVLSAVSHSYFSVSPQLSRRWRCDSHQNTFVKTLHNVPRDSLWTWLLGPPTLTHKLPLPAVLPVFLSVCLLWDPQGPVPSSGSPEFSKQQHDQIWVSSSLSGRTNIWGRRETNRLYCLCSILGPCVWWRTTRKDSKVQFKNVRSVLIYHLLIKLAVSQHIKDSIPPKLHRKWWPLHYWQVWTHSGKFMFTDYLEKSLNERTFISLHI